MTTSEATHRAHIQSPARRKALHISLWIAQVLLAVGFGMAGVLKTTKPIADLAAMLGWPGTMPAPLVRFIGLSELAGAIGVLAPALTRIEPVLTAWAATGLFTVMVLASLFHLSRGEAHMVPTNIVLGGLAAFVAWGRFGKAKIAPRT